MREYIEINTNKLFRDLIQYCEVNEWEIGFMHSIANQMEEREGYVSRKQLFVLADFARRIEAKRPETNEVTP